MSSVRMCDNCGRIFSEAEDGWQTGRVVTVNKKGIEVSIVQDRCPDCAIGVEGQEPVRPNLGGAKQLAASEQPA